VRRRHIGAPKASRITGYPIALPPGVSTRRRLDPMPTTSLRAPARSARGTPTTPLRAAEIAALLQSGAGSLDDGADANAPTVEMVALEPEPEPPPRGARGSAPVRGARGTRRSREILRVDDIRPGRRGR
jgi:hypothetical protein